MKKIRSYTSIWNVEKVLYAINDVNLPFPVTFTQITWFVLTEFIIILFADVYRSGNLWFGFYGGKDKKSFGDVRTFL